MPTGPRSQPDIAFGWRNRSHTLSLGGPGQESVTHGTESISRPRSWPKSGVDTTKTVLRDDSRGSARLHGEAAPCWAHCKKKAPLGFGGRSGAGESFKSAVGGF